MGRIKNTDKYPIKHSPKPTDYVIGSDSDAGGKTVNFLIETLGDGGDTGTVLMDNKPKLLSFGFSATAGDGTISISSAINYMTQFSVEHDEIPVFRGIVYPYDRSPVSFEDTYIFNGLGKGTYGQGGIQITEDDLILIERVQLTDFPPIIKLGANAHVEDLGEIGDQDLDEVINSASPAFVIENGTPWYFEFTRDGRRFLYGYSGLAGTYGNGQNQVLAGWLFLVYAEDTPTGQDNIAKVIQVGYDDIEGYVGTLEEKIAQYINDLDYEKLETDSEIWVEYTPLELLEVSYTAYSDEYPSSTVVDTGSLYYNADEDLYYLDSEGTSLASNTDLDPTVMSVYLSDLDGIYDLSNGEATMQTCK